MTTVRSLAIIALLIGGTSPALAQNAPPTDGIRLPPLVQRGTLLRTDHPERALSPEHQDRLFNLPRLGTKRLTPRPLHR
jgi:hypothetical protein